MDNILDDENIPFQKGCLLAHITGDIAHYRLVFRFSARVCSTLDFAALAPLVSVSHWRVSYPSVYLFIPRRWFSCFRFAFSGGLSWFRYQ